MNYNHESARQVHSANCLARDMEFVALYNPTLKLMVEHGVPAPRRQALKFVIFNGHPRYHVSYKRAYEVVRQLLRHGKSPSAPSMQVQMWQELAGRVASLCQSGEMSIARALEFVLEHCRASRFFITEQHADAIIDRARREYRRRKTSY